MSYSALSDSFEYLCYVSTAIINIFLFLQRRDRHQSSESDVDRRQILTTEVGPCAVRVNSPILVLSDERVPRWTCRPDIPSPYPGFTI